MNDQEIIEKFLAGASGELRVLIDGEYHILDTAVSFEATVEPEIKEEKIIGRNTPLSVPSGYKASGSLTIKYGNPIFRKIAERFVKTNELPAFDMLVTNKRWKESEPPIQTLIKGIVIKSFTVAKLNASDTTLEEDFDFDFTIFETINQ